MHFRLFCKVRHLLGDIDTTATIQADTRIEADTAFEAFIAWLQSGDAWLRADGKDQRSLRQLLEDLKASKPVVTEWESNTEGVDWSFNPEDLNTDENEFFLAGTSGYGEWEFEIDIDPFKDRSELDNGLFIRDPSTLSLEALSEIVRYVQAGLFLDNDGEREVWTLDKDVSGSDFIDHVYNILRHHNMVPEEVDDQKTH